MTFSKQLFLYAILLLGSPSWATEYVSLTGVEDDPHALIQKDGAVALWDELDSRKRLNTFFVNEQDRRYGLQVNYTNVRKGNLTFLRRDLVRLDRVPIVFGRVYDSSQTAGSDFGPGWKLSVAESISVGDAGQYVYRDTSNSTTALARRGESIRGPNGLEGRISSERIELMQADSLVKVFRRVGSTYYLTRVRDRYENWLKISYDPAQKIRSVASNHGLNVTVTRDADGRIVKAMDDLGRTVRYEYDPAGRLAAVDSDVQSGWTFEYDGRSGRLAAVVDPRGEVAIRAEYDNSGRASSVRVLDYELAFSYSRSRTEVRDGLLRTATFWHHPAGVTQAIQDFTGRTSHVEFDPDLRPISLAIDGANAFLLSYDAAGRLVGTRKLVDGRWIEHRIAYTATGRIRAIHKDGEPVAQYRMPLGS